MKLNDRLERVQVGRLNDIPLESSKLWYLLIFENDWDACTLSDLSEELLKRDDLKHVFVVWHGQWRTNLFLVDKIKLLKKLVKVRR